MTVRLRWSARARRLTLRVAEDGPVLTLPAECPVAEAERFLHAQAGWLRTALARVPAPEHVGPGTLLPIDGRPRQIEAAPGATRVRLEETQLLIGGSSTVGPRLAGWLKARARARIVPLAAEYADRLDRRVAGYAFRDTRSRWGSCSSTRRLAFCWRLAMAPPEIQAYVAAHEAAHLVEMNHGPRFWALLDHLRPAHREERAWLKREGAALRRYRFGTEPGAR